MLGGCWQPSCGPLLSTQVVLRKTDASDQTNQDETDFSGFLKSDKINFVLYIQIESFSFNKNQDSI